MCCFSRPVIDVSNTKIFARIGEGITQFVAYSMSLNAKEDLAMVLPIPVAKGTDEKAVKFINLKEYSRLFEDLFSGFPAPRGYALGGQPFAAAAPEPPKKLEVHSVGSFDASFVPSIPDFSRLDERFRLPGDVWKKLPGYADFGFAVFKLKAANSAVHPMAFSFPSAIPQTIFFPTLHIHDGQIHERETFDHTLYAQGGGINTKDWQESPGVAVQFVKCGLTDGMVSAGNHVYRREIQGLYANGDILLKARKVEAG